MADLQLIFFVLLICVPTLHSFFTSTSRIHDGSFALKALKFDPSNFIEVAIAKPFGMSLEEVEEGQPLGVMIGDCNDKGNAKLSGIVKGLFLCSANNIDLKYKTFDEILVVFASFSEGQNVKLTLINPKDVFKGPAILNVKLPNGDVVNVKSLKGQNLRQVLMDNKIDVYSGKAKLTNCNGGLSCGTCAVEVTNNKDWETRPNVERLRLKKYNENARLSCNTIIEGDCEIKVQPVP